MVYHEVGAPYREWGTVSSPSMQARGSGCSHNAEFWLSENFDILFHFCVSDKRTPIEENSDLAVEYCVKDCTLTLVWKSVNMLRSRLLSE